MSMHDGTAPTRRSVIGAAAAAGALLAPGAALAQGSDAAIRRAVAAGKAASVKRIQDWIALPTIAGEKLNGRQGGDYMVRLAKDAGFQTAEIVPTHGNPGVLATWDVGAKRTLGVYFMYDVKQYDPAEWSSPPLEARLVDKPGYGKVILGRGATNSKGPQATFLAALHALRAAGRKPPVNLVLVCEGDEEIGSPSFGDIVGNPRVAAALKRCEGLIVPSGMQTENGSVQITLGSKGIIEGELVSSGAKWGRGPEGDIHSSYKAQVDSPAWHLIEALATLVSPDGNTVAIDGWMDGARALSARQRQMIAATAATASEADAKRSLGVPRWIDDLAWAPSLERLAGAPTFNLEGLVSGYTGPGGKTIMPGRATAKFDCRLVPGQTHADCVAKLKAHLAKHGFPDIEVNITGGYNPTEVAEDARVVRASRQVFTRVGAAATLYPRSAGSWPGCYFTDAPISLPATEFGLGLGGGAHAPDEYYVIDSSNPKVAGLEAATMGYVDYLYAYAA